jgi:hypothetical protein
MSKPIVLNLEQWAKLHTQLAKDTPASVMLIRDKMKTFLGFTVRRHTVWKLDPDFGHKYPKETVRLDFYNEPKRTMFLLKYSEYLDKTGITDS